LALTGHAQKFDRITLDDGLSQSNINCIIQDKLGFIWFGTNGGLNRYDGSEFEVYLHNIHDSTSISDNIINDLFEDSRGMLWIGTQNGLNMYNPRMDRFTIYKTEPGNPKSLSNNIVTSIIEDSIGNIWVGTEGGGLNKFDTLTKTFTAYQYALQNPYSISSNKITSLELDRFGYVWAGTEDKGANMIDPATGRSLRYVRPEHGGGNNISHNHIHTIYEDNDGDLWLGTAGGLDLLKPRSNERNFEKRDRIYNYQHHERRNSIGGRSVLSIYQGMSGLLWIGTDNGGLTAFDKNSRFTNYAFNPNSDKSLLSNKISAILDDRSGILWIGTNAGINKIDLLGDRFVLYERKPGTDNTLSSNNVQTLYKELSGTIWVGTFDGGLNRYEPSTDNYYIYKSDDYIQAGENVREHLKSLQNKRWRSRVREKLQSKFISHDRILSLHRDLHKTLWIGTGGGGLDKLDLSTGKVSNYRAVPENADSLSHNTINVIYEDKRGIIWLGTQGGGLNAFDRSKFKRYLHFENDVLSISSNNITAITEDQNGQLWIGTYDGGLNVFNRKNETFKRLVHNDENPSESLSSNSVYCLYADDSSRLWIGTNNGLNMYDLESKTFKHYSIEHNFPSNFIYSILGDGKGNLWISTNKGISKFDIDKAKVKNYDKLDGLQGNEFNPGAAYATRNGEMLFGGINGFNSFYPSQIKDNNFIPDVVITDFKILGEKVPVGTEDSPLQQDILYTEEIVLSHQDKAISFEFAALNYTNPEKNQYTYIMEGFEDKWNYVGTRQFANYTNLPPGEYTFRVKATNNDGVWNEEGVSLRIIVEPPFYNTWWFYLLLIATLAIGSYLFVFFRIKNLEKSKIVLRELVKARTNQLSEEKSRVERANSEITFQKNEIESQRNLLMKKNKELTEAKQQIDETNEELKSINSNLENIVQERTATLRHTNNELYKAINELDLFIYRASHDLKGPIDRLLGLTQVAKLDNITAETLTYVDKIELGAKHLNEVLGKLTNVHHINKGQPEYKEIKVKDLIMGIINNFHPESIKPFKTQINTSKANTVSIDQALFKIIMENLIENAIMFCSTNTTPTINISTGVSKHNIKIIFEDNGIGIPENLHEKVFDMFYRASDRSKGSGLGLYLVKKAVEKMKGNIEIESEVGLFTRFTIHLPIQGRKPAKPSKKQTIQSFKA